MSEARISVDGSRPTGGPIDGFGRLNLTIDRDGTGLPVAYMAHMCFAGGATHRVHKYGHGPFCRIRITDGAFDEGVYLVTVDGSIRYVGRCQDARQRWGQRGYGLISPRNCYNGGQLTNCKINHRVLEQAQAGRSIELWFMETPASRLLKQI